MRPAKKFSGRRERGRGPASPTNSQARRRGAALLVLGVLLARPAAAEAPEHALDDAAWAPSGVPAAPEPEAPDAEPSGSRRALATGAAIFPGALVHGAGHLALGKPQTGTRLLVAEGVGLVLLVSSGVALALTGANRWIAGPTAAVAIGGAGLLGGSWLADVYGSAVPESSRGQAPKLAPVLVSELGHRYVYDPQFRYRHFVYERVDLRFWRLRLEPSAWFSLDDSNARYRFAGAYRFAGPLPNRAADDGSFLDLELAATEHRFDSDGFRTLTGEALLGGRLDLVRADAALHGTFAELGLGWGLSAVDYDVPGLGLGTDHDQLLLARFAFGVYLGDPHGRGGEARVYYDHRHDDFAAGMKLTGLGSGVAGHFGVDARFFFGENWGVAADAQVGSAYLMGASLLFRQGARP